mgnify:CR=1 FL=1
MVPFLNMVMLADHLTCFVMDGAVEERQELHIEGSLPHSTLRSREIAKQSNTMEALIVLWLHP